MMIKTTHKKNKPWADIRAVLPAVFPEENAQQENKLQWLGFQWNILAGKEIAKVTRLTGFTKKKIILNVPDGRWLDVLNRMKKKLIQRWNVQVEAHQITGIQIKENPEIVSSLQGRPQPQFNIQRNDERGGDNPHHSLLNGQFKMIKDASLLQVLRRLEQKFRFTSWIFWIFTLGFLPNCVTFPNKTGDVTQSIDLESSYSIKEIQKANQKNPKAGYKDPRAYFHYLLGLKASNDWDFNEAIGHFKQVVEHDSRTERFYLILARLYLRAGRVHEMIELCKDGLKLFPDNHRLSLLAADGYSSLGQKKEALGFLEKGIENQSDNPKVYLLAGIIYLENHEFDRAKEIMIKLTHLNQGNPLAFHYLGRVFAETGEWSESEKILKHSLTLKPSFKKSRELLAWVYEQNRDYDNAKKEFQTLIKLDPDNLELQDKLKQLKERQASSRILSRVTIPNDSSIHLKLGILYYDQSQHRRSLEELRLYLAQENPVEKRAVHLLIARIYELYERYEEAIMELESVMKMEPESVTLLLQVARMHNLNEKIDKAIEMLNRAVKIDPTQDQLHHSLSLAYLSKNEYETAIQHIRKAIEINSTKDTYYFELGALLERVGHYQEAIDTMKHVIELNPMHSNAHNFIGYMYALQGLYLEKAIDHLEKALAIQPRNGYFLDSLGWVYYKKGEHQKALAEIKKAMIYTKDPDPVLYQHLGDVHFSLKNYLEANKAWMISLSLTRQKIREQSMSELPNPEELEEKLLKIKTLLNQSL